MKRLTIALANVDQALDELTDSLRPYESLLTSMGLPDLNHAGLVQKIHIAKALDTLITRIEKSIRP